MSERPTRRVPLVVIAVLCACVPAQLAWRLGEPSFLERTASLSSPPPVEIVRLVSLGEDIAAARLLTLYLQAFDRQGGNSLPLRNLDYAALERWLDTILQLDPNGQYPLLLASRIYAEVADVERQRRMMDFVYRAFARDPNRRWPWLAHVAVLAKHRLGDRPLALHYARTLRESTSPATVPAWVRGLEYLLLEEMSEFEAAKAIIGGLIQSGKIHDPAELRFLLAKYKEMELQTRR